MVRVNGRAARYPMRSLSSFTFSPGPLMGNAYYIGRMYTASGCGRGTRSKVREDILRRGGIIDQEVILLN